MVLRRRRRSDSDLGPFPPGWDVPSQFNFTRDVVDAYAQDANRAALAFVDHEGIVDRLSFAEISADASRWAHLLRTRLDRGDRVLVMLGKTPSWHCAMLGALKGGLVAVPCPDMLRAADLAYRVRHSGARLVLAERANETEVEEMRNQVGGSVLVLYLDEAKRELTRYLPVAPTEDTRASESALILYTSGTTKEPRGVVHTHAYTWAKRMQAGQWLDAGEGDVVWCTAGTGWAKAVWNVLLGPWSHGAEIVMHEASFEAEERLGLLEKLGVTILCQAPTEYRFLAKSEELDKAYLPHLRHAVSAGEPLNPEVIARFQETLGLTIHDGYGQTENTLLVANLPESEIRPGSMGLPTPGHDVAVIDEAGHVCPPGVEGDLALIGRPPTLFTGYWEAPDDTDNAFRDGWYVTGDRATRDEEGYLWFVGRADDVILSSAYRIGPFEVESALLEHPAVKESAVVGVPDEDRGQIVKAFVVLREGHDPDRALVTELQEHVKAVTAPYKYPRAVAFVDDLPKTSSGKIRRAELRANPDVGLVPDTAETVPLTISFAREAEHEAEAAVAERPGDATRAALAAARRAEAEEAERLAADTVEAERARSAEEARTEADAQARREAEAARALAEAEAQARRDAEAARALAEAEAQARRDAEAARAQAEAEAQERRDAEAARAQAEAEAQARRDAEAARAKAEAEAQARREAERARQEAEAARARAEAEERARREAEAARAQAEAETRARREAEERARREAEEARARAEAEERARREAEEARARAEAEERARREAEEARARAEAEERARLQAAEAERVRLEAEETARREAEEARRWAEAEEARLRAEAESARREAEELARHEADALARRQAQEAAALQAAALDPRPVEAPIAPRDAVADEADPDTRSTGWREKRRRQREEAARAKAEAEEARHAEHERAEATRRAEAAAKAEAKRQEAEAKERAKAEAEQRKREEAEEKERARAVAEQRKREEAEEKERARAEAEQRKREEAEAKERAKAEAEQRKREEAGAKEREKAEAEQRKREEAEARRKAEASSKRQAREEAEQKKLDAIAAKENARRREAEAKEASQRRAEEDKRRQEEERAAARERAEDERRRAKELARLRRGARGRLFGRGDDQTAPLEEDGTEETIPDLLDRLSRYSNVPQRPLEGNDGDGVAEDALDAERPSEH